MKIDRKIYFFIFFIFCANFSWGQVQVNNWSTVYQKVKSKIPIIVSAGGICSGALIEQDIVVTAAHCVDRMHPISVHFKNLPGFKAKILVFSRGVDLALIQLNSKPNLDPIPLLNESEKNVEGSIVSTIGHPVGQANFKIQ